MEKSLEELMKYADKLVSKYFESGIECLNEHEQTILSVWLLEGQVSNGGFDAFYFNSHGDLALTAEYALLKIGAPECSEIVKSANANFENGAPPQDWNQRQDELERLQQLGGLNLDALDTKFYKYPNDLIDLMYKYMEEHSLG